jgi:hypothetical protein
VPSKTLGAGDVREDGSMGFGEAGDRAELIVGGIEKEDTWLTL